MTRRHRGRRKGVVSRLQPKNCRGVPHGAAEHEGDRRPTPVTRLRPVSERPADYENHRAPVVTGLGEEVRKTCEETVGEEAGAPRLSAHYVGGNEASAVRAGKQLRAPTARTRPRC